MNDYWRESFELQGKYFNPDNNGLNYGAVGAVGGSREHYDYIMTIIDNVLNNIGRTDASIKMKYGQNIGNIKSLLKRFEANKSVLEMLKDDRFNEQSLKDTFYTAIEEVNKNMNDKQALIKFIGTITSFCEDLKIPEVRRTRYALNDTDFSKYLSTRMTHVVNAAIGIKPVYCKIAYLLMLKGMKPDKKYEPIFATLMNLYMANIDEYRRLIFNNKDLEDFPKFIKDMYAEETTLSAENIEILKAADTDKDVIKGLGIINYDDILTDGETDDETIDNEGAGRRRRRRKTKRRKGRGLEEEEEEDKLNIEGSGKRRKRRTKKRKGRGIEEEEENTEGGKLKLKGWNKKGNYYYNSKGTKRSPAQIRAMIKFKNVHKK